MLFPPRWPGCLPIALATRLARGEPRAPAPTMAAPGPPWSSGQDACLSRRRSPVRIRLGVLAGSSVTAGDSNKDPIGTLLAHSAATHSGRTCSPRRGHDRVLGCDPRGFVQLLDDMSRRSLSRACARRCRSIRPWADWRPAADTRRQQASDVAWPAPARRFAPAPLTAHRRRRSRATARCRPIGRHNLAFRSCDRGAGSLPRLRPD